MVKITVNDKTVTVSEKSTVLDAVKAAGVALPTLCHHEGVSPYGACRLCMVEMVSPRKELIAACVYPIEAGMVVDTRTEQAVAARQVSMEFLLARCPSSGVLKEMAADMGVDRPRFLNTASSDKENELCVLCGLCVRVCHDAIGAGAIGFAGKGKHRRVTIPFDIDTQACIGCGACAAICPTGAIRMEDRGNMRIFQAWNMRIELNPCPECGRYFAPISMTQVRDMFAEVQDVYILCPDCRNQKTAAQVLAGVS